MSIFHDEVEIEDFQYDEESDTFYYPCPCGDQFEITKVRLTWTLPYPGCHGSTEYIYIVQEDLENGEDIAECPSCSLIVKVIYDHVCT